jgi:hypothetical protein
VEERPGSLGGILSAPNEGWSTKKEREGRAELDGGLACCQSTKEGRYGLVSECAGCWVSKVEVGGREQWRLIHRGLLICLDLVEENGASAEARKGFLIVEYRL